LTYLNERLTKGEPLNADSPVIAPERVQLEFRDNKVLIDNMARFDTFLRICKGEFAEEVITRKLILATDSEDPLAKES
jgi:hypothetical protein